jgi:tetratricopeptide (TPR) repeat protein
MLTLEDFRELLQRPESETLDFKSQYEFKRDKGDGKLDFVKDVICMANTPRAGSAFIIVGVKKHPDGTFELKGVASHPDEADLQSLFTDKIHPQPIFTYYPFSFEGKTFGVVEIAPHRIGPCAPIKDFGNILRNTQIYFRRGSQNDIARPDDIRRIFNWLNGNSNSDDTLTKEAESDSWEIFKFSMHNFNPLYKYLLIVSRLHSSHQDFLPNIGLLPWTGVFDFDPESESTGLLRSARTSLSQHRTIHLTIKGNAASFNPDRSTTWFFARGLQGRSDTLSEGSWKDWKKAYGRELKTRAEQLARAISPSPTICIVIWEDLPHLSYLRSLLETLLETLADSLEFIFVTPDRADLHSLASEFGATLVAIPLHQLLSGIRASVRPEALDDDDSFLIPSRSGAPVETKQGDIRWLEEDLEILHLNIGIRRPENREIRKAFLQGNQITWYELGLHSDVDRDISEKLEKQIRRDLTAGRAVRINLFHSPGAGGTTVARRVAWDLHRSNPTVIISRYQPEHTAERLFRLASLSGQSVLAISDGADIADRQTEQLFDEIRSRQIPVVMLQVLRRFSRQEPKERSFYLDSLLSSAEAGRFVENLSLISPSHHRDLLQLATSADPRQRSPFYFGLQVFGKDFLALSPYVSARLPELPDALTITTMIAFVHRYGQHSLPAQIFTTLLGLPQNRAVRLRRALPEGSLELLTETKEETWRTAHDLIAVEILEQCLSIGNRERQAWKQNLSRLAGDFIEICVTVIESDEVMEILRRVFIYRDNVDVIGSERAANKSFSHLIEDVDSREGRLATLRKLAESFPGEAHFWAHLGRFYSIEMGQFDQALECVERALTIQPEDHLLCHMKGMILRKKMEQYISTGAELEAVETIAREASDCFQAARDSDPDDEHGYISEAQMLCRLLDYGGRKTQKGAVKLIAIETTSSFIRGAFERAEGLLERVRRSREGEGPSAFEIDCRAKLDSLYGEHEQALQIWTNLLTVKGIYRPPLRRQIVRAYLARKDRSWSNLNAKEIRRSIELLEENLQEDRYNDSDLRLWMQAVRYYPHAPSMQTITEQVAYWKSNSGSLEATFYLFVLHALLAIEGFKINRDDAELFLAECRQLARRHRNRRRSFEWLGQGQGISALVHQSELGEWNTETDFWSSADKLRRIPGRIAKIDGPQAGVIEAQGGLDAFFVPGKGDFFKGRAENEAVDFFLGFSYDGLRAWGVQRLGSAAK